MLAEPVNLLPQPRYLQCFDTTPTVAVRCLYQALLQDVLHNGDLYQPGAGCAFWPISKQFFFSFLVFVLFCFALKTFCSFSFLLVASLPFCSLT